VKLTPRRKLSILSDLKDALLDLGRALGPAPRPQPAPVPVRLPARPQHSRR
jgi:hypothetical protein